MSPITSSPDSMDPAGRLPLEVLVLGGGFAGLECCKQLDDSRFHVTLVDRQNHHLFQPLLYQVATAGLSAPEIAQPLRSILADQKNVTTLMEAVLKIDLAERAVTTQSLTLKYDYLVIALGVKTGYFGHPEWEPHTLGLKSLDDAMRIRQEVLQAFERAEAATDPAEIARLLTLVVVGGGPTGVEVAGALAELTRVVFQHDFRRIDPSRAQVHLIESGDRLLSMFPTSLSDYAHRKLQQMGVQVHLNCPVQEIGRGYVVAGGERIETANILWAAGTEASPVTRSLAGVPLDRAGRIQVMPDLSLPDHPEVFAAGDLVSLVDVHGVRVPGVSPAAMQMGKYIANLIKDGPQPVEARPAFAYRDKGSMATIGRKAAVANFKGFKFRGFIAWLAWLFVHLIFLMGMRNRLSVLLHWTWSYFAWQRGARIIVRSGE